MKSATQISPLFNYLYKITLPSLTSPYIPIFCTLISLGRLWLHIKIFIPDVLHQIHWFVITVIFYKQSITWGRKALTCPYCDPKLRQVVIIFFFARKLTKLFQAIPILIFDRHGGAVYHSGQRIGLHSGGPRFESHFLQFSSVGLLDGIRSHPAHQNRSLD